MTKTARIQRRFGRPILILTGIVVVLLMLSLAALPRLERFFLLQAGQRGEATLRLAVEGLQGALNRYEPLPALIADRPLLRELLANPEDAALRDRVSEEFRQMTFTLSASDVYLMDTTGLTIAASSYLKELSFVGRSFNYRPYFTQALDGGIGRYFALGTTSGERGYFFAAPVEEDNRIIGVVAVKFTVDAFEATWARGSSEIIVSDLYDVVFMSSREDWHFRALSPLSPATLRRIETDRQYPLDQLRPLQNSRTPLGEGLDLARIEDDTAPPGEFVTSSVLIPEAGWRVSILTPTGPARAQALAVLAIVVLLILFGGLIAAVFLQRRAQFMERLAAQRDQQELLERRVRERTIDLDDANRQLLQEVEERRAAETRLRKTQAELVQAGKLAALGQMSAALSHEFNQPLAAVKSYAENAATFLDRGRAEEARQNVERISGMADRMAAISKHLRNFARRPQEQIGTIPLVAVVDDALELMDARLSKAGAEIDFARPEAEIWVKGGRVRLQQVIVNLISNALDAMAGHDRPRIEIAVAEAGGRVTLSVRDHGPGLTDTALAQAFDPFFTTKEPGQGLGLGLSISYNIVRDFGGTLSVANDAAGGAVFSVALARADAPGNAAGGEGLAAE